MTEETCPICKSRLNPAGHSHSPMTRTFPVNCPRCGAFSITSEAHHTLSGCHSQKWPIASHAIRRQQVARKPFVVTQAWLQSVVENGVLPRPQEQANTMISILGENSVASGRWIPCQLRALAGLLGTDDPADRGTPGVHYVIDRLKQKNLIEQESPMGGNDGSMSYRLTFDGWERFEELRRGIIDSKVGFMAMKFGEKELDRAFETFIAAVKETGFELRRLDQKPKAGLIDLHMRVEIRSAKFLIADLTDENRGAYWEAGFAEGLGKKVYYTCEKTKYLSIKTHFDTEHMLTVQWNPEDMTVALDELKSAIRNDFPADAIQSDDDI